MEMAREEQDSSEVRGPSWQALWRSLLSVKQLFYGRFGPVLGLLGVGLPYLAVKPLGLTEALSAKTAIGGN